MKQITCPHCADTYPDFDVAHVCSKGPYAPKLKPKMNERIKKLAEQAELPLLDVDGNCKYGDTYFSKEKFAELIIKRCRDIVSDTRDQAIEEEWNVDEAMSTAMYDIEEYFGVEQ